MMLTVLCVELRAPEWQDGPGQQGGTQCDAGGCRRPAELPQDTAHPQQRYSPCTHARTHARWGLLTLQRYSPRC